MKLQPLPPFEPISASSPPSGDEWIAQIKWDGVRMLLYHDGEEVRLYNRRLNERTMQYPELLQVDEFCSAKSVILDGEIIAFDEDKRVSFQEVMKRDRLLKPDRIRQAVTGVPVTYMVFDILYCSGEWLVERPLSKRQQVLQDVLKPSPQVQIVQNFEDGEALFNLMRQYRMEGVVYKDRTSTYGINGKDGRWRKLKVLEDLYAIVGGATFRGKTVNSLLLGVYDEAGKLLYIGNAGAGRFTQRDWELVTQALLQMKTEICPFEYVPPPQAKGVMWVRPFLVIRVEYLELTRSGTLRQPTIQGVASQIPLHECTVHQFHHRQA